MAQNKLLINNRGRVVDVRGDHVASALARGFIKAPDNAMAGQYLVDFDTDATKPSQVEEVASPKEPVEKAPKK